MQVAAILPQVDVSLVMPPGVGGNLGGKDSIAGGSVVMPDSSSTGELHEESMGGDLRTSASDHSLARGSDVEPTIGDMTKSHSEGHLASPGSPSPPPSEAPSGSVTRIGGGSKALIGGGISALTRVIQPTPGEPPGALHDGFSSMRRGLTSLMSSIESSVRSPEDASDTLSVRSDLSSDSDTLPGDTPLHEGMDALFSSPGMKNAVGAVEVATEVLEENSPHSDNSDLTQELKRKDPVRFIYLTLTFYELL